MIKDVYVGRQPILDKKKGYSPTNFSSETQKKIVPP
jgi:hypothetical protein